VWFRRKLQSKILRAEMTMVMGGKRRVVDQDTELEAAFSLTNLQSGGE
jgi:hypothetical protein